MRHCLLTRFGIPSTLAVLALQPACGQSSRDPGGESKTTSQTTGGQFGGTRSGATGTVPSSNNGDPTASSGGSRTNSARSGTTTGGLNTGRGGAASGVDRGGQSSSVGVSVGTTPANGGAGGTVHTDPTNVAGSGAGTDENAPACALSTPRHNGLRGLDFNAGWKFNRGDAAGAEATGFDDARWKALDVPHDWSIELAFNSSSPSGSSGGYLDGGIGWYRKTFTLDEQAADKRILIQFDGVYMNSQVWINGTSLGTRPYGYSSFEYDLTPYLKRDGGPNVLAVKVNNNQPNSRWYSGSGIYRNVWLTTLSPIHVPNNGVFVTTANVSTDSATISVSTDLENQSSNSASVSLTTTIAAGDGRALASNDSTAITVEPDKQSTLTQNLALMSPRLWSVEEPYLYRVKVEVKVDGSVVDTYVTSLGIRTAAFDGSTGFSLNGQNMKLRGVNLHHDLGALGAAVNCRAIERQIQILKTMGVNAIRTAHNPPAPELLEITDRLGVLVLDEAFDTWEQTKTTNDYGRYFKDWAERDIKDMVRRDRNHPSVILWSIGNEVGGATTAVAQKLKGWVLELDKTRPVTWASNKMGGPHVSEGDDRNVAKLLDVVGYNYAPYAGDYDADHQANPNWVTLGTETSAAVRSRGVYHTPASKVTKATSQSNSDRQCSSYDNEAAGFGETAEKSYAYDQDRAFVAGSFIWAGFDYIGEPTPYSSWPSKSSYFGAIDTAGFPKDVYYFYKSRWTQEPMVHLLPHWNWAAGTTVTVYAYNNCDSVELFLNDTSQGSKSSTDTLLHAEWTVPWVTGTLRAECKKGGSIVATDAIKTAGAAAKLALSVDRESLFANGKDLAFISADVQDSNGVLVPAANQSITFSVSGPAELIGVDNGDPTDTTSYKASTRKAFNGKALAIVRATRSAGRVELKATATGLTSGSVNVTAR